MIMTPKLILLVGPPGSGKSTLASQYEKEGFIRISQDEQGIGHLALFDECISDSDDIIVDRMNFNKEQRKRYLEVAKQRGYSTKIIVLHESYDVCFDRCKDRQKHPTIKDKKTASKALHGFFSKYERVSDNEADEIERRWPSGAKDEAIISDLDGTLCNIDHRLHFVKADKKDWKSFFDGIGDDKVNEWCAEILWKFDLPVVLCSGRPDSYRKETEDWLEKNNVSYNHLFMRERGDYRSDDIAKEIILDFEILTRFKPYFVVDDRDQVVKMWRKRGLVCLQCANGEF